MIFCSNFTEILLKFLLYFAWISVKFCFNFVEIMLEFRWYFAQISLRFSSNFAENFAEICLNYLCNLHNTQLSWWLTDTQRNRTNGQTDRQTYTPICEWKIRISGFLLDSFIHSHCLNFPFITNSWKFIWNQTTII